MPPPSRLFAPLYANTGSVARDHLAAERTFLAWLRTGLGFVALGIAIERFSQLDPALFVPPGSALGGSASSASTDSVSTDSVSDPHPPAKSKHSGPTHHLNQSSSRLQTREQVHKAHEAQRHKESLLAVSMLGTGCASIFYGAARYFSNLRLLERGFFKPAYHGAGVLSVGVACLAGGAWWSSRERERERVGMEREG